MRQWSKYVNDISTLQEIFITTILTSRKAQIAQLNIGYSSTEETSNKWVSHSLADPLTMSRSDDSLLATCFRIQIYSLFRNVAFCQKRGYQFRQVGEKSVLII